MILLDEELKPISPQEAKDCSLFGPVYHGATSDKLEKINTQGFKFNISHEREGNTTHGIPVQDYVGGVPPPIHFLGFGVYFTTSPTIAKEFGYGNTKIGPYFLDMPRMTTINWGSPNTMMKWWVENGYDYKRTPETTYGSGKTDLHAIRQERMRATLHLTETLKLKYDGVWYKGRGIRRLLDGDQVVIFNPDKVYKLDKTLVKPGEIGSKVVAKVSIDKYNRGNIDIPIGTKGIIVDKKKPHPEQKWAEGSEWIYEIRWEKGGTMWEVLDSWIEPYQRAKLRESIIQRRGFWKEYEQLVNETEVGWSYHGYLPISKQEEDIVVDNIKRKWGQFWGPDLGKTLKKIRHDRKIKLGPTMEFDMIDYEANCSLDRRIFHIRKTNKGVGFSTENIYGDKDEWKMVIPPPSEILKENEIPKRNPRLGLCYELSGRFVQKHDDCTLIHGTITNPKNNHTFGHAWVKLPDGWVFDTVTEIKWPEDVYNRFYNAKIIKEYSWIETVRSLAKYRHWGPWDVANPPKPLPKFEGVLNHSCNSKYEEGNWKEGDEEHYKALQQTGYWGRQGAGAIILAKDTGRILLPLRSRMVEQPNTWGVWGGAIDDKEDPASAVRRELSEEVGHNLHIDELIPMYVFEDLRVGFKYSNFLVIVPKEFTPKLNWETKNFMWIEFGKWPSPIHFGLKALLQHSGNDILKEVRKYSKQPIQESTTQTENKEKYKAAISIIKMVWAMMYKNGDYKNRFDYNNTFVHWMLNDENILNNLLPKYGKQFYPNSVEPHYDFAGYIEKILEILEQRYYKRITKNVDKNDPLYYLKQVVKNKSWRKAKNDLRTLISGRNTEDNVGDDMAENLFNRMYRSSMGETFFDASKMTHTIRLDKLNLRSDIDNTTKSFIQHYNKKGSDRFPDKVKVWRGFHTPTAKIRPGDFVTFDNAFARGFVSSGKHGAVISDILPSKDLLIFQPSIDSSELIYWPEGHQIHQYTGPIPTFKEFYLQYK